MANQLGFNASPEENFAIWEANSRRWGEVASPLRPSIGDKRIYEDLAGTTLQGTVLVLGATPEIRDLVAPCAAKVVLVDQSPAMLAKMSEKLLVANPLNEVWIKADWCKAPLARRSIDLVIGDMVWWVMSVEKQRVLCDAIAEFLKPEGRFVSRFRVTDPENKRRDPLREVMRYLSRLREDGEGVAQIRGEMLTFVYDYTANFATKRFDRVAAKMFLLDLVERPEMAAYKEFLQETSCRLISADWTSQESEEVLDGVLEKFDLAGGGYASDYDSKQFPIFSFTTNGI